MKDHILVFGVGDLQKSIIERCKLKGLFTVGMDPSANATCRNLVDAFEIVGGQDFERTIEVAERHQVRGIITAATDKPLVMMARVAEKLQLPFFSVETAECSTDKLLMKQKFQEAGIPCAKGFLLNSVGELANFKVDYPVIVKPRDNSGSRGVIYCKNGNEVEIAFQEALLYTRKGNVLIEEFIEGKEYSIESLHYDGKTHVIQFTEKITTAFPYNVELGHIQPADVTPYQQVEIKKLISEIAQALHFTNCASHTEIKINSKGIYVIETSPRLGGDFISSTLVPLSTGINMEDILIDIATNHSLIKDCFDSKVKESSGIKYFELPEGIISAINGLENLNNIPGLQQWHFSLKPGDRVNTITSSLNRYGYGIFQADTRNELVACFGECEDVCNQRITIE
jgi:biotin carboxylase